MGNWLSSSSGSPDLDPAVTAAISARSRESEVRSLQAALSIQEFQRTNKCSFREQGPDGDDGAALSVTSGLELPAEQLPSMSTAAMIGRRTAAAGGLVDAGGCYRYPEHQQMLLHGHTHGFIAAVTAAFKDHYPLALRPQHFWLMVAQGIATHVDLHAEAVRQNWVPHEGKKSLTVNCDEFVLGQANDWEKVVCGKTDSFSAQIAASSAPGVVESLSPPFSDTTTAEDIAQKIVVMDVCKNYFDYKCSTMCGFPEITLEGSKADWQLLRQASERLLDRCTPEFRQQWGRSLLPLLDKLIDARTGRDVDAVFWNSMCKRGGTTGSGARTWFNGWINIFFPYIDRRPNRYCEPYSSEAGYVMEGLVYDKFYDMFHHTPHDVGGPDCEDFPSGMSAAPVNWDYLNETLPLNFNAGFVGATQDPVTLQIRPAIGWYITRRPVEAEDIRTQMKRVAAKYKSSG